MEIGKRIKELRERSGFSQNYLADTAGISQTHLRRVELGQADITVGHLQLVCDALSISLKDFFDADNSKDEITSALARLTPKQRHQLLEFVKSL